MEQQHLEVNLLIFERFKTVIFHTVICFMMYYISYVYKLGVIISNV